jgi:hypothetical protein
MRLDKALLSDHGAAVYAILIAGSAAVLMFSMPWASRLSELIAHPWHPFPLPFFLTYTLLSAVVALNRGASAVPSAAVLRPSSLLLVLVRIGFGQLLVLPLLTYSRVLFPTDPSGVLASVGHVLLASCVLGYAGTLFELYATQHGRSSAGLRYGFLLLYAGAPLLFSLNTGSTLNAISLLSPLGSVRRLLSAQITSSEKIVVFLIPAVLAGLFLLLSLRACRRLHHG